METHIDQGVLECEYKESIKNYRSLMRQGLDETLEKPGKVAQELITETRLLLDKKKPDIAKQTLKKLASHLKMMKSSFPGANVHVGHELNSSIHFIDQTIKASHLSSIGDRESHVHMEKARFAMQNEDWAATRECIDKVIGHYLGKQQQRLLKDEKPELNSDAASALKSLETNGAACRSIQLKDIKKIFQLAAQQHQDTCSYSILASPEILEELFSSLSQRSFVLERGSSKNTDYCAVLRLSIDRQNTIYLIGIPVSPATDVKALSTVLQYNNAALINFNDNTLGKSTIEKLLITCLENIRQEQVFISEGALSHTLSGSDIEIFRNLEPYRGKINSTDFINWATKI